jgi:hypothetical protein
LTIVPKYNRCQQYFFHISAQLRRSLHRDGAKSGRFHYYMCRTTYSKGEDTCPSQHLPKDKIERYITDKVKGCILTHDNLTELVRLSNIEIDCTHNKSERQLAVINRELKSGKGDWTEFMTLLKQKPSIP